MYGDGEPHLCPTGLTSDVQPGSLTLTATTATWSYTISQPDYIWGFKVRSADEQGPALNYAAARFAAVQPATRKQLPWCSTGTDCETLPICLADSLLSPARAADLGGA